MTSASMSFGRPVRVTFPRGSLWFGNLAAFVLRALSQPGASALDETVQPVQAAVSDELLQPRCRAWIQIDRS